MKNIKYILVVCIILISGNLLAQGQLEPIYFSGFIVDSKHSDPMVGVHLYIPKAGRGSTTNSQGFFALATLPGDSIVISYVGYKKHVLKIPEDRDESYTVVIELIEDNTMLPVVEVHPYPTEELFKEAFLALELEDEEMIRNMRENLNQRMMTILAMNMPMDANMNYKYQMHQSTVRLENRNTIPSLQLLNPFAWANLIQSIKRGDFKKDKWKK
jgi:hypothetical protein